MLRFAIAFVGGFPHTRDMSKSVNEMSARRQFRLGQKIARKGKRLSTFWQAGDPALPEAYIAGWHSVWDAR